MQFSIHRIWLLFYKQWAENRQLYILGLLAIAGLMAAVIVFNMVDHQGLEERTQENIVLAGLMLSSSIFTTTILSQFNDKIKGIQALTLPASTVEKLAVALVYSLIIFPACFLVFVYPILSTAHYIDAEIIGRPNTLYVPKWNENLLVIFLTFLLLQGLALLCSVLFKRYVFIKATILTVSLFFGVLIINPIIAKNLIGLQHPAQVTANIHETIYSNSAQLVSQKTVKESIWVSLWGATPYSELEINNWVNNKKYKDIDYSSYRVFIRNKCNAIFCILLVISIPFLWLITWFRLKEKEL